VILGALGAVAAASNLCALLYPDRRKIVLDEEGVEIRYGFSRRTYRFLDYSDYRISRLGLRRFLVALPLDVEQIVEFPLAAVGVFELFGQFALVALDHFFLFLELIAALGDHVLLFVELPFSLEHFLPHIVELIFYATLFSQRQLLGLHFGFLMPGGSFDFGLFDYRLGFFLRIAPAEMPQQFEQAHPHAGRDGGNDDDHPWITSIYRNYRIYRRYLGQHRQLNVEGHGSRSW